MSGHSYEFDPVESLGVTTVGAPGSREFFLQATGKAGSATLACEKFHVEGLVAKIAELLAAHGLETEADDPAPREAPATVEADWTVGELGLGYHPTRRLFFMVAREAGQSGGDDVRESAEEIPDLTAEEIAEEVAGAAGGDAATARFWITPEQVRAFARQAEKVLAAGRPSCPHCGLPVDPRGHACPASNGSRPIL